MWRRKETLALLLGDFLAINLAWLIFYYLRVGSGWFAYSRHDMSLANLLVPMAVVYGYWMLIFTFYGLYRPWYQKSHFDEFSTLFKAATVGMLIFFVTTTVIDPPESRSPIPYLVLFYWAIFLLCTGGMRSSLRAIQRKLFESGIGTRPSIIVGTAEKAEELLKAIRKSRPMGFDILGFVSAPNGNAHGTIDLPRLGTVGDLGALISTHNVKEVLVAMDSSQHGALLELIGKVGATDTHVKIMPDLYDVVSGQARIAHVHGLPLIDVSPHLMQPWEEGVKRIIDVVVSGLVIIIGLPVWFLIALFIVATSRGGVFYRQERVGRDGREFNIVKFRTMRHDAEKGGPQWAVKNDPRVTVLGKFLRKTHLDEVPQFWNVLRGEMSLVGPRPERSFFIDQFQNEIPYYRRRLAVRPGITGWYQVSTDKYDENIDDVRRRLKYDLYYIENMSVRLDLKIIFATVWVMVRGRGQA